MSKSKYKKFRQLIIKYINDRIKNAVNGSVLVKYNAYNFDTMGVPINNLDDVVVSGYVKFYQRYVDSDGQIINYISRTVRNPTWSDVIALANDMIHTTGIKKRRLVGIHKYKKKVFFSMKL